MVVSIALIGSAGLGAVWGWLLGMAEGNTLHPVKAVAALIFATAVIAAEVLALAGSKKLIAFGVATFLTLFLHIGWRRDLRLRLNRN